MTRSGDARLTRRQMLRQTATVAGSIAAPLAIRSTALGLDGATAPSNRITIGTIGVGRMGCGHFSIMADYPDVQLVALSDVDSWRRDHSTEVLRQNESSG